MVTGRSLPLHAHTTWQMWWASGLCHIIRPCHLPSLPLANFFLLANARLRCHLVTGNVVMTATSNATQLHCRCCFEPQIRYLNSQLGKSHCSIVCVSDAYYCCLLLLCAGGLGLVAPAAAVCCCIVQFLGLLLFPTASCGKELLLPAAESSRV